MKSVKLISLTILLSLGLSVAYGADKKSTRTPAAPEGAVGLPQWHGSGMPPGAMGMPAPLDASCRRAAGMAAVKEALEDNDNGEDCHVRSMTVVKTNISYRVEVTCFNGDEEPADVDTYLVKTRLKSKKSAACRATSAQVVGNE